MEEPYAIATGDFNGDKKLDLAVGDYIMDTVVILQGNGEGTFTNIGQWYAGASPGAIAVSDFNRDGKADLAVSDYAGSPGSPGPGVATLTGKGDGTFLGIMPLAAGNGPSHLAVADLNHDGSPDLVVIISLDDTFSVLLNAAGTHVQLTGAPEPSGLGQSIIFEATVRGSVTASPIPSGTITFRDGPKIIGRASLTKGTASLTSSSLALGTHRIAATYSGDADFNPNQSVTLVHKVN